MNDARSEFRSTAFLLLSLHPPSELFFGWIDRWVIGGEQAEAVKVGMRVVVVGGYGLALPTIGTRWLLASTCTMSRVLSSILPVVLACSLPLRMSLLPCLCVLVGTVEMPLQHIGGKFLAHSGTIQHTAAVVVNEGGTIDASRFRVAEYHVHALLLQTSLEVLHAGTLGKYGQYLLFQRSGNATVCNHLLRPCETLQHCLVAD